ncbi:20341_t:CDS:2 [Funneliformis geosporum]|uniref:11776_t:CDS:1 n=1 Tax=Funneliformis geosporum TaxID=1117311 RepID=A0A9W4SDD0_9GLOM|nr:11776_t:CDS:2 [Funneliformis geosporum]CAI2166842.1 20341_t:CDS:2 [Funneliformis geosporum]
MAPALFSSTHCLSPYGGALHEKPTNLSTPTQQQKMFKRSNTNLTTMKMKSEENISVKDTPSKPLVTASEDKCMIKSSKTQPSSNFRQRSINWTKNNIITPALSSTSLKKSISPQNVKQANTFDEILSTTHRTEREVKASLSKLRRMILDYGLPDENLPKLDPSVQNLIRPTSLRSRVWKHFLGVYHVSAHEYVQLIQKKESCVYDKIRNDTFRTLATDEKFLKRVNEDMLIRVLNALVWKMNCFSTNGNQQITYVQGMNVLAAPFLFTMSEIDAFFSFATFIQTCCPLYVTPTLQGVHCGLKNLTAEIYALSSVLTLCACTPPLEQVLKLWDFLLAYGIHLNILCVIAQLILMRDQLLEAPSPMKLLRTMPELDAKPVINLTVRLVQQIPDKLYDLLVRHPYDPSVESSL